MAFYNRTYILKTVFAIFCSLYFCIVFAVTNNTPAHLQPVPSWLQCNNTNANQASFFGRIRPSCEISKIKDEVVCWLNDPENSDVVLAYKDRLQEKRK